MGMGKTGGGRLRRATSQPNGLSSQCQPKLAALRVVDGGVGGRSGAHDVTGAGLAKHDGRVLVTARRRRDRGEASDFDGRGGGRWVTEVDGNLHESRCCLTFGTVCNAVAAAVGDRLAACAHSSTPSSLPICALLM